MQKYEEEFNELLNYALSNQIGRIVFQNRKFEDQILMVKHGSLSSYNYYEKDHLKDMLESVYEKCTSEKLDYIDLGYKQIDLNFNSLKLKLTFIITYPYGFDVYIDFI